MEETKEREDREGKYRDNRHKVRDGKTSLDRTETGEEGDKNQEGPKQKKVDKHRDIH